MIANRPILACLQAGSGRETKSRSRKPKSSKAVALWVREARLKMVKTVSRPQSRNCLFNKTESTPILDKIKNRDNIKIAQITWTISKSLLDCTLSTKTLRCPTLTLKASGWRTSWGAIWWSLTIVSALCLTSRQCKAQTRKGRLWSTWTCEREIVASTPCLRKWWDCQIWYA